MSSEPWTEAGPDPRGVRDRVEFAASLQDLKRRSGRSFRTLERATAQAPGARYGLPFTTIRDYVRGRSLPSPDRLEQIVWSCGVVDDAARREWVEALHRVAGVPTGPVPTGPVPTDPVPTDPARGGSGPGAVDQMIRNPGGAAAGAGGSGADTAADDDPQRPVRDRVTAAAQRWDRGGRQARDLLRGAQLEDALRWAAVAAAGSGPVEGELVAASLHRARTVAGQWIAALGGAVTVGATIVALLVGRRRARSQLRSRAVPAPDGRSRSAG